MNKSKEQTAAKIIQRLEKIFPALDASLDYLEVGTQLTHDRFLGRIDGSY
jgi:prolycopene isomerase